MGNSKFYGTEEITSLSYLEFGAIDLKSSKKLVWDLKLHQKAYDWYMHARYSNDIYYYTDTRDRLPELSPAEVIALYCAEVHHKDDFSNSVGKLCALAAAGKSAGSSPVSFFELGQTLFGCIDAVQFTQALLAQLKIAWDGIDLAKVQWNGVDISDFFNKLALLMHRDYSLYTSDDLGTLPRTNDIFFAKGVTVLYAVRSVPQLIDLMQTGKLCIFDYSFGLEREEEVIIGSGKVVKYLKLADFTAELAKLPRSMYVKKGSSFVDRKLGRVTLDCLYAEEATCSEFIELDGRLRRELNQALGGFPDASTFLDTASGRNGGWITLDEFLKSEGIK